MDASPCLRLAELHLERARVDVRQHLTRRPA
jgi:hypothetical protein